MRLLQHSLHSSMVKAHCIEAHWHVQFNRLFLFISMEAYDWSRRHFFTGLAFHHGYTRTPSSHVHGHVCWVRMWYFNSATYWLWPSHSDSSSIMTNGPSHSEKFIPWFPFLYPSPYMSLLPMKYSPTSFLWLSIFLSIFWKTQVRSIFLWHSLEGPLNICVYCWQHSFAIYYLLSSIVRYILIYHRW